MKCRTRFLDSFMKKVFYNLGYFIGERPGYFVIIPVLVTLLCATGFEKIHVVSDPEYLFTPVQGPGKLERSSLEKHFPTNFNQFDPTRSSKPGRFGRVLITSLDGGSLLRSEAWFEISFLDSLVRNVSVVWEGDTYNYEALCAKTLEGKCWSNEIVNLSLYMEEIQNRNITLTYPIWFSPDTFKAYPLTMYMGGLGLSPTNEVDGVAGVSLAYFLDSEEDWRMDRGKLWENAFLETLKNQRFEHIKAGRFASVTLEQELENNTETVKPYFGLNIIIMVIFCIFTSMMTDWVKSKPLLGLFGVVSAIMGSMSAFGLVMYLGMDFIGINLAAPFLMLGIGIDDTFVMLAAWRRTSIHDTVPKRVAEAYREASISITITSITDMLSFWIGAITPFPCVRIFSIYTGACVAGTYIWHLTFFGGCLAVAGYAEKQNRHAVTCRVVIPTSQSGTVSFS